MCDDQIKRGVKKGFAFPDNSVMCDARKPFRRLTLSQSIPDRGRAQSAGVISRPAPHSAAKGSNLTENGGGNERA